MFTTLKLICSLFLGVAVMTAMHASAAMDGSGTQGAEKQSTQKSKEHSKAKTTSKKQATDTKAATDFSTDVDVNSLLIQEFIAHYENKREIPKIEVPISRKPISVARIPEPLPIPGESDAEKKKRWADWFLAQRMAYKKSYDEAAQAEIQAQATSARVHNGAMVSFNTCKPFLGARNYFPLSNANFMDNPNDRHAIQFEKTFNDWRQTHQPNMPGIRADANDPVVSDYAKCRIAAHFWVTAAAMHLAQESIVFTSEEAAKAEIDRIFDVMDESPDLFSRIVGKTNQVWDSAICSSSLPFNDESLTFNCGTFVADASSNPPRFVVNGRETLSSNGIDGKKFKIAMSQSAGNSQSDSLDFSESDKTSKSTATGRSATVLSK